MGYTIAAMPTSVPHVFALAHGLDCAGPHRCWYCGAPCGEDYPVSERVLSSFTARDTAACPSSPWVCPGCVLAMRTDAAIALADGTASPQGKVWMHSWLVTRERATAYATCLMLGGDRVRAHLPLVRAVCLDPPPPPFALCLTASGQKHTLYRAAVARDSPVACLEGENIPYEPAALRKRLALLSRLCAACGPKSVAAPPSTTLAYRAHARRTDGLDDVSTYEQSWREPLTDLARFLLPSREECESEYPADR